MNQPVPDLAKPYSTARERIYATVVILRYWQLIEQLMKLVDMPSDRWSIELKDLFPASVPGGPPEHPQQRLERWLGVYADEIKIIRTVRNQLVHAEDVNDFDLRGTDFLTRVILAALFDVLPTEVDESWAISKINAISHAAGL
jgi:hypothetical protein